MSLKQLALVPAVALAFGLTACDDRDYEGEIATLQTDLESARAELEAARGENEQLSTEMEELRAQAEQAGAAGEGSGAEALEPVQSELAAIVEQASVALANLTTLEAQPDAPAEIGDLRQSVEEIMQSAQTAASELGLEMAPAPAAGGQAEQPEQPAAQQEQPPAGAATEAPATGEAQEQEEGEQPQQQ